MTEVVITGSLEGRSLVPVFVKHLMNYTSHVWVDVRPVSYLKAICPRVREVDQLLCHGKCGPDLRGVIRICNLSDHWADLDELEGDLHRYCKSFAPGVAGVFICVLVVTNAKENAAAKYVEARLTNLRLESIRESPDDQSPVKFTSLYVLSEREELLGQTVAEACELIIEAPYHSAITKMSLTTTKDNYGRWIHGKE